MSLQLICCECDGVISNGCSSFNPFGPDLQQSIHAVGNVINYDGTMSGAHLQKTVNEVYLCGKCLFSKLPNIAKTIGSPQKMQIPIKHFLSRHSEKRTFVDISVDYTPKYQEMQSKGFWFATENEGEDGSVTLYVTDDHHPIDSLICATAYDLIKGVCTLLDRSEWNQKGD